jgi:hypothetical protein
MESTDIEHPVFHFPRYIKCHGCGAQRTVIIREVYQLPAGTAAVALAKCRKCRHTFVRFLGEKEAAARLAERWLGLER